MYVLDVVGVGGDAIDIGRIDLYGANVGICLPSGDESVDRLNVVDHRDDAACEEKQERNYAEGPHGVKADEDPYGSRSAMPIVHMNHLLTSFSGRHVDRLSREQRTSKRIEVVGVEMCSRL